MRSFQVAKSKFTRIKCGNSPKRSFSWKRISRMNRRNFSNYRIRPKNRRNQRKRPFHRLRHLRSRSRSFQSFPLRISGFHFRRFSAADRTVAFSQELFAAKSRLQEQEQIIVSLRRDLAGMAARLSDVQGEMTDKQKRALEKSDFTIREQTKELNETRTKLSKLSDIVDKQSAQIEHFQSDLS